MRRLFARTLHCAEAGATLLSVRFGRVKTAASAIAESTARHVAPDERALVRHWAGVTDLVARYLWQDEACLIRAAALKRILARRRIETDLRIGVRKQGDGSIGSHAWLEHGGEVVIGRLPDLDSYIPFS